MMPRTFNNGYSGKQPGLSNMIILSLVVHLAVLAVIFVSLPTSSRHLTFGPVYSVSLVSQEAAFTNNKESSLIKEIGKSSQTANSIIYKRQVTGLAPTPVKKEEINRLNIEKAVSALQQKQLDKPSTATSTQTTPAGSANKPAAAEFNSWMKEYSAQTKMRVTRNFNIPPALAPKENIQAIIAIKILRNGTLDYANFEKHSGNRYFDDAALKAVKKSVPFAPFPEKIRENSIEIGIIFHPSQLR